MSKQSRTAPPVLLRIAEAAAYIGRNEAFMRRLRRRGELTVHKPGGVLLYDIRDLDAYLASCREAGWRA